MAIGKKLAALIEEKKSNVHNIATRTGINPATIYSIIKRDNMKADIDDLAKICHELGVTLDYFTSEDLFPKTEKAPAKQELTQEHFLLIKLFDQASSRDKDMILRLAELAAAANQRSSDLSPEQRAREVLRQMALQDSLSADGEQAL